MGIKPIGFNRKRLSLPSLERSPNSLIREISISGALIKGVKMKKLNLLFLIFCLLAANNLPQKFKINGYLKNYYLQENNHNLKDYFGNAFGGELKITNKISKNFSFAIAGYFSSFINTNISKNSLDPITKKNSRYVKGLVDLTDLNKKFIANLGDVYLKYHQKNFLMKIGRFKINTPFLNPANCKMIPNIFQGIYLSKKINTNILSFIFINAVWPKGTPHFRSLKNSLGYGYGEGVEPVKEKVKGDYYENISTNGLYVLGYKNFFKKNKFQFWDYYAQNLFNLAYIRNTYKKNFNKFKIIAGVEYGNEKAVGNGGNADVTKTYMKKNEKTQLYGIEIGSGFKNSLFTFNYNYVTNQGRFMFPREWGKMHIFTFQHLESTEGNGGWHAWCVKYIQKIKKFKIETDFGKYYLASINNHLLNKYIMPSFAQFSFELKTKYKNIDFESLFSRKYSLNSVSEKVAFAKVNMNLFRMILKYNF